eukprot:TRINITY_DN8965_c0_g1_i2.p1 TRINITY_DN8965_c0_g1~~TRINITY_DN8965_c0_g1_i2.p1  ORF type:complete len:183 (+),score=49.91 TRINITY_DN8965_c0_g1_i2:118-666(+)
MKKNAEKKITKWTCPKCNLECHSNWIACRDCGRFREATDVLKVEPENKIVKEVPKEEPKKVEIPMPEPQAKKVAEEESVKTCMDISSTSLSVTKWECSGCDTEHVGNETECGCCGMEAPEEVKSAIAKEQANIAKQQKHQPPPVIPNALLDNTPDSDGSSNGDEEPDMLVTCDTKCPSGQHT